MAKQRSMYGKDDLYVTDRSNPKATRVTDVQKWRTNQDDIRHLPGALPMQKLAIQDGAIGPSAAFVIVDTEGGAPADELTTINPGDLHDGMDIELVSSDSSRVVTIRHSISPSGIRTKQNTDIQLDTQMPTRLKLVSTESLTYWQEIPAMKLTDSVSSTDSTTAASAAAVKAAYDQGTAGVTAANAKLPLTGGTMLGSIQCGNSAQFVVGTQEAPFYQMRARLFGVHSPAGVLCGIMTADAAANYFSIEPTGGAIVNSYCGRPGSAFQHGYFANMNGHPLAATIIGGASGEGWFYRKYSDGFIEQWGIGTTNASGDTIITLPTAFARGYYNLQTSFLNNTYPPDFYSVNIHAYSYSTVSFYVEARNGQNAKIGTGFSWYACGF